MSQAYAEKSIQLSKNKPTSILKDVSTKDDCMRNCTSLDGQCAGYSFSDSTCRLFNGVRNGEVSAGKAGGKIVEYASTFGTGEHAAEVSADTLGECAYLMYNNNFTTLAFDESKAASRPNCKLYHAPPKSDSETIHAKVKKEEVSIPLNTDEAQMIDINANVSAVESRQLYTLNMNDCQKKCSNTSGCGGIAYSEYAATGPANCKLLSSISINEKPDANQTVVVDGKVVPYMLCGKTMDVTSSDVRDAAACYAQLHKRAGYKGAVFDTTSGRKCTLYDSFCKNTTSPAVKMVVSKVRSVADDVHADYVQISADSVAKRSHVSPQAASRADCQRECTSSEKCNMYTFSASTKVCRLFSDSDEVAFAKRRM